MIRSHLAAFADATLWRTLALGFLGGAVFAVIGMPVPWLSGPALATAIAALARQQVGVPKPVRFLTLVFLGATIGAAVRPETLEAIGKWPFAIAGLAVSVVGIMSVGALYLERVHGFDRATARLSAIPGALPYVLALSDDIQADKRRVMIIQVMRLACLVMFLPAVLTALGHAAPHLVAVPDADPGTAPVAARSDGAAVAWQLVALMVGGLVGGALLEWLKAPAGALFGSMVAGALLYGSGMLTVDIPEWIMLPGLLVIGAMVGANFAGTDMQLFRATALAGLGCLAVGAAVALVCAVAASEVTGLPAAELWLAYAPGGADAMAIMALALGFDAAFVGGNHVLRFFGLGLFVPLWMRGSVKAARD